MIKRHRLFRQKFKFLAKNKSSIVWYSLWFFHWKFQNQRQSAMQRQRSQRQRHNASVPAETATHRRVNSQTRRRILRPQHRVVPRMLLATNVPPTPPAPTRMDSARIRARLFHAHLNELNQSEMQDSRARMLYNDYGHVMRDSSSYLQRISHPSHQIEPASSTLPSPLQIGNTDRNNSLRHSGEPRFRFSI